VLTVSSRFNPPIFFCPQGIFRIINSPIFEQKRGWFISVCFAVNALYRICQVCMAKVKQPNVLHNNLALTSWPASAVPLASYWMFFPILIVLTHTPSSQVKGPLFIHRNLFEIEDHIRHSTEIRYCHSALWSPIKNPKVLRTIGWACDGKVSRGSELMKSPSTSASSHIAFSWIWSGDTSPTLQNGSYTSGT